MIISRGPFPVSQGDVLTGVIVQSDDEVNITASGWVSFARIVGMSRGPDGDDWATPTNFPAPNLRKHSLIFRFGNGPWKQGGYSSMITVPPGESGEIIFRANDDVLWDNDNFWQVNLVVTRPNPSPLPPGPVTPNLRIISIEVAQAIQRADNSVRLVHGKLTMIRVFVDSGLRNGQNVGVGINAWPDVTGSLVISDAITNKEILMISRPSNAEGVIIARSASDMDREDWKCSLDFEIPLNIFDLFPNFFNQSLIKIEATINTSTPMDTGGNDTQSITVSFFKRSPQKLLPLLVNLTHPEIVAPAPTMSAFTTEVISGALPIYPVAETGFIVNPPGFWPTGYDLRKKDDWGYLLVQISTLHLISSTPVDGIRCAIVPDGPWAISGMGTPHIWGSVVPAFVCVETSPQTFAHELGHTFGVLHSQCSGTEESIDLRNIPGRIDDVGYGLHTLDIIPRLTPDIMSYCHRPMQWCSVQFYEIIFSEGVI